MSVHELVVSLKSCIPARRLCDSWLCKFDEVVVKAAPDVIESICIIGGSCSPGFIPKQINFVPGRVLKKLKLEWGIVNKEEMSLKYIIIDKSVLGNVFVKIEVIIKIEELPCEGSIVKSIAQYFLRCGANWDPEIIKQRKERLSELFKHVEKYLLANPDV